MKLKKILSSVATSLLVFLAAYLFFSNWLPLYLESKNLEGKYIGDLMLEDENGMLFPIKNYQGTTLILSFWAGWCPSCRAEIPLLNAITDSLLAKNKKLVGVNLNESWQQINRFRKDQEMRFQVVRSSKELSEKLAIQQIPVLVIIDKSGHVHSVNHGFRPWVQPYLLWWID